MDGRIVVVYCWILVEVLGKRKIAHPKNVMMGDVDHQVALWGKVILEG